MILVKDGKIKVDGQSEEIELEIKDLVKSLYGRGEMAAERLILIITLGIFEWLDENDLSDKNDGGN